MRQVARWEIGGFFFIGLVGAALHFTFELSDFSDMVVAFFSAVNESTWEHLKMAFWPGVAWMLIEYTYVRGAVRNYLAAKVAGLALMPLVIALGWYGYTAVTRRTIFPLDLALFYIAVLAGQLVSYRLLTGPDLGRAAQRWALGGLAALLLAFSTLTFYPPRIFLFEHFDLKDTGQYGILESYDGLRYFTKPKAGR